MGSVPKEILKFMGKQSLIDGGVEGVGGGILGFINDGTKGAIKGSIGGFVSGAVTGLISVGVSFKFQKPKVSAKDINKTLDFKMDSKVSRLDYLRNKYGKLSSDELQRLVTQMERQ